MYDQYHAQTALLVYDVHDDEVAELCTSSSSDCVAKHAKLEIYKAWLTRMVSANNNHGAILTVQGHEVLQLLWRLLSFE
jgi:hypothetical protein